MNTVRFFCWVIGTPTKRIFPIKIEQDEIWGSVKEAIKEEKKNEFADIDADTLDLRKVTISLSQRSLLESGDFLKIVMATDLLDPAGLLSTDLNDPLPDGRVNIIIVQRPTYAEESILEELEHLRTHFWGQNRVVRTLIAEILTAETIDLSSANLLQFNPHSNQVLLVREEYRIAYDTLIAHTTKRPGRRSIFLITGQSGIGKTFFLLYFLFRRLQEREPVALQINAEHFVILDQNGVRLYHVHAVETFSIPKGIWTLSDSSGVLQLGPCSAFQYSATHLLHTSSPSSHRWKDWVKELSARTYIMDVWLPDELRTLLTVSNLNIQRGLTLFHQYGSDIRTILSILDDPLQEAPYLNRIQSAAAKIAREFSTTFQELLDLDFSSKDVSSKIFTLRPKDLVSRLPVLTIPTKLLTNTLTLALCRSAAGQQHAIFAMLNSHPTLRSPAGWMFENLAHVVVADSNRPRLQIYKGVDKEYSIPAPAKMISGNTALRGVQPPFHFYWRPRESNYQGVDAVICCGNEVWALQYTVSRTHRDATAGLAEVYNNMNWIQKAKFHLVMIGLTESEAKSA